LSRRVIDERKEPFLPLDEIPLATSSKGNFGNRVLGTGSEVLGTGKPVLLRDQNIASVFLKDNPGV
jgi:hypothetical protein